MLTPIQRLINKTKTTTVFCCKALNCPVSFYQGHSCLHWCRSACVPHLCCWAAAKWKVQLIVTTLTVSKVSDQPCRRVNPAVYSFQDEKFSEWESPFDVLQNMRQSFDCHYNLPWQVRTYTVFPHNHQVMWLFYSIGQPLEVFTWHCSFNCIVSCVRSTLPVGMMATEMAEAN